MSTGIGDSQNKKKKEKKIRKIWVLPKQKLLFKVIGGYSVLPISVL